ncbi:uncharacterized protein K452DRAFT_225574 [Aplosporella prunicola CBS 121167]|uniref:Cytochrome P450 n=1 Tax=Aplosporella prunicola CBS 121167 TaxID=1176127 RepID=A0A6A6BHW6_9PEZI|nr:uncharacterized protein K452DRAFT_225574 [Aplosporella prunicola CBS 121167]KAF2143198.1 hypothetical protein K452DRAFT_225574 [Aplosporella prunicola CBS 121167]
MDTSPELTVLIKAFIVFLLYGITKAYTTRNVIGNLRRRSLPMPPWSWFFGHMFVVKKYLNKLPSDAVFNYTARRLSREFPKHSMFYVDFWPMNTPFLIIANPLAASQITQKLSVQKPLAVQDAFAAMTGGPNLLTMPDVQWKRWRAVFSPGFSNSHMLEQVPKLIDKAQVFCEMLREKARANSVFQLEEATFRLTIDVIGLICLDTDFNYQLRNSEFPSLLRSLIEWQTFGDVINPLKRLNPYRKFITWYWGRRLNYYIHSELRKRFNERRATSSKSSRRAKPIVALALDSYLTESPKASNESLDANFKDYATAQLRLFLVAGHDTTSSAMTYTLHLLYTHPSFLASVREEHDAVFGKDRAAAASKLRVDPALLNQLPLTSAAIKEALRLFPLAGGIRMGSPDIELVAEDGTRFPTAGCSVWIVHEAVHRNPAYWPDPDAYLPERWLVGPEHPLYPKTKGAWRAFEIGPRNCIGQTLALTELKTVLVMTLREFDISPAYDEWDRMHSGGHRGIKTAMGERAYQVSGGGGGQHPSDRYPCRVSMCG